MHLKKKSGIGMHLSNYNLFSFLVPEGEALGNQTCSSLWNLVSSIFHSCPLPMYVPRGIWTPAGYTSVCWSCSSVLDPYFSVKNPQVQPLGQPGMGHPQPLGVVCFSRARKSGPLLSEDSGLENPQW